MNSKTIARNTVWYGLENLISFATTLITSIAIARDPRTDEDGLHHLRQLADHARRQLGSVGLPATTRKYMAEFLGGGDSFYRSLHLFPHPSHPDAVGLRRHLRSGGLGLSRRSAGIPHGVASAGLQHSPVDEQLHLGTRPTLPPRTLSANLPGSIVSTATYFILTLLAVTLGWGVNGIAFADACNASGGLPRAPYPHHAPYPLAGTAATLILLRTCARA